MFKFDFPSAKPASSVAGTFAPDTSGTSATPSSTSTLPLARRLSFDKHASVCALSERGHDVVPIGSAETLFRKSMACVPECLSPCGVDIVAGEYEGGFKLWECGLDLAVYLEALWKEGAVAGKSVLELGAGHAFPGIVAIRGGAGVVHMQDYNEEVVREVTMVNVRANMKEAEGEVGFFVGGWRGLGGVLGRKYDIVVSADTVYAGKQVKELADCLVQVMEEGGEGFVAGKRYYFGVGGGTREFEKRVREVAREKGIGIDVVVAKEIRDGVSNVREILHIRRT